MEQGTILLKRSAQNASGGYIEGRVDYTAEADASRNARKITLKLYCRKGNDRMALTVATSGVWHYTLRIGTLPLSGYTPSDTRVLTDWQKLAETTATVPNDNDGMLSAVVGGSVSAPAGTSYEGLVTEGAQQIIFGRIERIGQLLSCADVYFGSNCSVRMRPRHEGFHYALRLSLGDWESEPFPITPTGLAAQYFAVPLALQAAHEIPNSQTGRLTVTLVTYGDAEHTDEIGSEAAVVTAMLARGPDTLPEAQMTLSPLNPPLPDTLSSLYIEGISRVSAEIDASAKLGAEVDFHTLDVEGSEDDLLRTSGTVRVAAMVYDTRGFSALCEQTLSVLPYRAPILLPPAGEKQVQCYRCDEAGNPSQNGRLLMLNAATSFSPLDGRNTVSFRYRIKTEDGAFGDWIPLASSENAPCSEPIEGAVSELARSYTVELSVYDLVGKSHTVTLRVPTGGVDLHLGKGGGRAAFGKYAEREHALEIAPEWQLYVGGHPVCDTVIDTGYDTGAGCYWRKWRSGRCEMFFDARTEKPTDATAGGTLHLAQCHLSLPFALSGAIVTGSSEDCIVMGGECYGRDLLFLLASGIAFDGTRSVSVRLTVSGVAE